MNIKESKLKSAINTFVLVNIVWVIQSSCSTEYQFEHYYSTDSTSVVTRINHDQEVYFINSYYKIDSIPEQYISPFKPWDSKFNLLVYWKGDTTYFLTPYGYWYNYIDDELVIFEEDYQKFYALKKMMEEQKIFHHFIKNY